MGIAAAALWFFHPIAALWLALLAWLVYRYPAWGVSLLFVTLSIDSVASVWGGIQVSFSELHLATAVLAFLARQQSGPLDWRPVLWGMPFLAVVALSGAVNTEWYKVPPHLIRASEWLISCFLTFNAFREGGSLKLARWALACAALLYCSTGFPQLPDAQAGRIFSFFSNPNQFAGYLGLLSPFFVMFFLNATGRRIRPVWGYLALLTLLAMVVSASRAALLGLMTSWLILWWLQYRNGIRAFLRSPYSATGRFMRRSGRSLVLHGLIIGLALFVALWLGGFNTLTKRAAPLLSLGSGTSIADGDLNNRLSYLRFGFWIWKEHWLLGVGPGRWEDAARARLPDTKEWVVRNRQIFEKGVLIHSHNLYIQLCAVLGLAGLLAFLIWIGRVSWELSLFRNAWARAGIGLLIAFVVHNLFDVTFPSLGQELGCLIGLALTGCQGQGEVPRPI